MRYKVVGPPGTGKTRRLLNEVQRYVDKGTPLKKIGYFAFTRKAAGDRDWETTLYLINNYSLFFLLV